MMTVDDEMILLEMISHMVTVTFSSVSTGQCHQHAHRLCVYLSIAITMGRTQPVFIKGSNTLLVC